MVTIDSDTIKQHGSKSSLVLGASGEQGSHVIRGLVESGFDVYCASRNLHLINDLSSRGYNNKLKMIEVNLDDECSVRNALVTTGADSIFLVTTTDISYPTETTYSLKTRSFMEAEDLEYGTIRRFFDILVDVYKEDRIPRHIIFSTQDNVKAINDTDDKIFINPLDDGSVVPHFTGKGRAADYAVKLLKEIPDLSITLLTLPFSHSNFLASTIPLPNEARNQWTMNACFGDAAIDMFSVSDLQYVVPALFQNKILYDGFNVRVSAERINMSEVACIFTELFGKDVIYNPLTFEEMTELDIPGAQVFSQMCQYLINPCSYNNIDVTETIMSPRKPQVFNDWLVTHSDHEAFERVGLSCDDVDNKITCITIFDATAMQGMSVIQSLLSSNRGNFTIRAAVSNTTDYRAQALHLLDPSKISIIHGEKSDYSFCLEAVSGADGVFLVTSFDNATSDLTLEELHTRNVIDACQESHTVKHLILSTFENIEDLNNELQVDNCNTSSDFDAKVRAAVYARSKSISCTYILVPIYSEEIFKMTMPDVLIDSNTGEARHIFSLPQGEESTRISCLNGEDLGGAVVRIFQSYELYAGHEIALISDTISINEAQEIIEQIFFTDDKGAGEKLERKMIVKDDWIKSKSHCKDLGRIFDYVSKSDIVKKRRALAKTMELIPDSRPLKRWLEQNRENVAFRSILGLR